MEMIYITAKYTRNTRSMQIKRCLSPIKISSAASNDRWVHNANIFRFGILVSVRNSRLIAMNNDHRNKTMITT